MEDFLNIDGIGEKKAKSLVKIGIENLDFALTYFPRTYEDKTKLYTTNDMIFNEKICIKLKISTVSQVSRIRRGLSIVKATAFDEYNVVSLIFFNQDFIAKTLKAGEAYVFFGELSIDNKTFSMNSPKFETLDKYSPKLNPIYKISSNLTQTDVKKVVYKAFSNFNKVDTLPHYIQQKYKLISLKSALFLIHYPKSFEDLKQARRRLDFERLFMYVLELKFLHSNKKNAKGVILKNTDYSNFLANLPYKLTNSQVNCINDCVTDMTSGFQLNRILQGDVGSGKTIVATTLAFLNATNNLQTAFIAPTEILARQHYKELKKHFSNSTITIELITGSTKAGDKKRVKNSLISGEIDIIIGTHAVFTDDVKFKNLTLVIIDEQHRFGVNQRSILISKGENPHTLVMSATPIPRTISLILYGDLDLSVINEMPKGRQIVDTFLCDESKRERVYNFINSQIDNNNQVYIVCPLVETSESFNMKNVTEYTDDLRLKFPDLKIGLIHGKIKSNIKDEVMNDFTSGDIDILVSTTVIEVGVNVPNATLMIIENAERFGLSTLHQLRGRVGRGYDKSYCILMSNTKSKRLDILTKTNDGFIIAKEDLSLRGAGDYYGFRQSGESEISTLDFDSKMLECASTEVTKLMTDTKWSEKYQDLFLEITKKINSDNVNIFN